MPAQQQAKVGKVNSSIYLSTCSSPSSNAVAARQQADQHRRQLSTLTSILGMANCSMKFHVVKVVGKQRTPMEITDYCKNKHVCPTCMGYQYRKLEKSLERTMDWWEAIGNSIYTQTLSLPTRPKLLRYKHQDLAKVWGAMSKSKKFNYLKKKYGISQSLRITEDSLKVVGSNPHFHLTWFFSGAKSPAFREAFCSAVAKLWKHSSEACGVRGTQAEQQWSGPVRKSNKAYSHYLTKHGYWDLSFDPMKPYPPNKGLKPLDFSRVMIAQGDADRIKEWLEYEQATYGKHRIQPSKGFIWAPNS